MKGTHVPSTKREHAEPAGLFRLFDMHFAGRGDDGEIPHHGAAHQRETAELRDIGKALGLAGDGAAPIGQSQAREHGDGGARDAPAGQVMGELIGNPDHQADKGESDDQRIVENGFFEKIRHVANLSDESGATERSLAGS